MWFSQNNLKELANLARKVRFLPNFVKSEWKMFQVIFKDSFSVFNFYFSSKSSIIINHDIFSTFSLHFDRKITTLFFSFLKIIFINFYTFPRFFVYELWIFFHSLYLFWWICEFSITHFKFGEMIIEHLSCFLTANFIVLV